MGRDNVLTVRQKDGSIKAMLNTCTHRGNAVCRAEEGNTKAFMCTYHGWSFDLAGNLIGVPDTDLFYKGDLDKSKYGLRPGGADGQLPRVRLRTMDETAPPLEEYLGPMGRISIDLLAARDVEIIPGIQKFIIDCNWKFAVDNLFDWYHPQVTHMSATAGNVPCRRRRTIDVGGAQTPSAKPSTFRPGSVARCRRAVAGRRVRPCHRRSVGRGDQHSDHRSDVA